MVTHPARPRREQRQVDSARSLHAHLGALQAGTDLVVGDRQRPLASDEVGVELVFGKPKDQVSEPGLHFMFWPIETVQIANSAEKLINIGGGTRDPGNSGLMLSGDQNIVDEVAYIV